MSSPRDLSALTEDQLLQAYIDNVRFYETIGHVGRANRWMGYRFDIVDELKGRGGGEPLALLQLLDHADCAIRYGAAIHCRGFAAAASERVMRALAQRKDKAGQDARYLLERWSSARQHDAPAPAETKAPAALRPDITWQCDNPPPAAMPASEIRRCIADAFPGRTGERLIELARPAIGLWPQRPRPDLAPAASRLGGMPHAPRDWSWPVYEEEPLFFLGQINCAELHSLPGAEQFPGSGLLAFFGDHDWITGCEPYGPAAIYHWSDPELSVPATPPIEVGKILASAPLAFRPLIELPDPRSRAVEAVLHARDEVRRYWDIRDSIVGFGIPEQQRSSFFCGGGKLLGWPSLIQRDLDEIGNPDDPEAFRLLLQLDPYTNGTEAEGWGPGGALYVLITDPDLRARRFDRCEVEMQCT